MFGQGPTIPNMSNSIPNVLVTTSRSSFLPSGEIAQSPLSRRVSNHVFFFLPLIFFGKMFSHQFDVRNVFFRLKRPDLQMVGPKCWHVSGSDKRGQFPCWELVKRQEFDCHPVDVSEIRRLPVWLVGYPIISKVLFIPGGYFGFLPSTVCLFIFWKQMCTEEEKESLWPCNCSRHCDICQKEGGKDSVC